LTVAGGFLTTNLPKRGKAGQGPGFRRWNPFCRPFRRLQRRMTFRHLPLVTIGAKDPERSLACVSITQPVCPELDETRRTKDGGAKPQSRRRIAARGMFFSDLTRPRAIFEASQKRVSMPSIRIRPGPSTQKRGIYVA
jgi:hypothetical protein